ncbi:unnamed protein product, partial [Prorocentrum cordatum]
VDDFFLIDPPALRARATPTLDHDLIKRALGAGLPAAGGSPVRAALRGGRAAPAPAAPSGPPGADGAARAPPAAAPGCDEAQFLEFLPARALQEVQSTAQPRGEEGHAEGEVDPTPDCFELPSQFVRAALAAMSTQWQA